MRNWTMAVALAAVAAASAGVMAQQKKATLTALDYAEINQLYIRYNYGIDTHGDNGMMWAGSFTKDGVFDLGGGKKFVGREALLGFAHGVGKSNNTAPHHFATNIRIEPSPEGAVGSAYFFNVTTPEPGKPAAVTQTGTYEDIIVKTPEGWRFKERKFYTNALPPAMLGQVSAR